MELTAAELWDRIQEVARSSVPEHSFKTWIVERDRRRPRRPTSSSSRRRTRSTWSGSRTSSVPSSKRRPSGCWDVPLKVTVRASDRPAPAPVPSVELPRSTGSAPEPPSSGPSRAPQNPVAPSAAERSLHVRALRRRGEQPARRRRVPRGRRHARAHVQPPLPLRGRGPGQDPPHARHRQPAPRSGSRQPDLLHLVGAVHERAGHVDPRGRARPSSGSRYREIDLLLVDDVALPGGEGEHAGGVLPHLQRALRRSTPDRPHERPAPEGDGEARGAARVALRVGTRRRHQATGLRDPHRHPPEEGGRRRPRRIDDEVIEFIAHSCTASVRELEGAVIKLLAYSSLTNQEITLEPRPDRPPRDVLGDARGSRTPRSRRSASATPWPVAGACEPEALASKRRTKDLTVPRQVAMYLIKEMLGHVPGRRSASLFGGRDHSTVIHSIRKVEEQMAQDPDFRDAGAAPLRRELDEPSPRGSMKHGCGEMWIERRICPHSSPAPCRSLPQTRIRCPPLFPGRLRYPHDAACAFPRRDRCAHPSTHPHPLLRLCSFMKRREIVSRVCG